LSIFASARFYRFLYSDGIAFDISSDGENVRGSWLAEISLEDVLTYLFGPIFGFILRLRGFTALHASAAVINGYAVAFVGGGGAGKSTIVGALARAGHRILSDDIAVLEEASGTFRIKPSYPHIRLWPDSVNILFGSHALPSWFLR
jgi:ATP-dependent phosphoenolpyruvate carboxykinase